MSKEFLQFPFNLPSSIYTQIVANTPGIYQISNPWNWVSDTEKTKIKTPTRIALDMEGEGLVAEDSSTIDMDLTASWDLGLTTDYTVAANRQGMWFFVTSYSDDGVVKFLLSDSGENLNTPVTNFRVVEKFFCITSDGKNYLNQDVTGYAAGDLDVTSFSSLTGASTRVLSGDELPDVNVPEVFFFNTATGALYFNTGTEWKVISEESKINDFDFFIGSVTQQACETVPTGMKELVDTRGLLVAGAYPKYETFLEGNLTKWGGDGVNTVGVPAVSDVAPETWVEMWTGSELNSVPKASWYNGDGLYKVNCVDAIGGSMSATIEIVDNSRTFRTMYGEDGTTTQYELWGDLRFDNVMYRKGEGAGANYPITSISYWSYPTTAPDGMKYLMYIGNGGHSQSIDPLFEARVQALEETLAVIEPPYDTGWVDYSYNFEGLTVYYPDCPFRLEEASVDIYYSTLAGSIYHLSSTSLMNNNLPTDDSYIGLNQIGSADVTLKTGTSGFYRSTAGDLSQVDNTDEGYLRVVLTKNALAPLMQANYFPAKDWVEKYNVVGSGTVVTDDTVLNTFGEGKFLITGYVSALDQHFTVSFDSRTIRNQMTGNISNSNIANQVRVGLSDSGFTYENLGSSTYDGYIARIEKWEDTLGSSRDNRALSDGWETLYEGSGDPDNSDFPGEVGSFKVTMKEIASSVVYTSRVEAQGTGVLAYGTLSQLDLTTDTNMYARYDGTSFVAIKGSSSAPMEILKIEKFNGMLSITKDHTNVNIWGENGEVKSINTSAGNVAVAYNDLDYFPAAGLQTEGYKIAFKNDGYVGNNLTIQLEDTTFVVTDQKSVEVILIDSKWSIMAGMELPNVIVSKDWVEVWSGNETGYIDNKWGEGRYKLWISTASEATNFTMTATMDVDLSIVQCESAGGRTATEQLRAYHSTANGFSTYEEGGDGFNGHIWKIEKWQDTTGQDRESVKLKDQVENIDSWLRTEDKTTFDLSGYPDGTYETDIYFNSSNSDFMTFTIKKEDGNTTYSSTFNDTTTTDSYFSPKISDVGELSIYKAGVYSVACFKSVGKVTGAITLSVNQTNRTIAGVPNTYVFKKDTTGADVTMVASDTWLPDDVSDEFPAITNPLIEDGDILMMWNSAVRTGDDGTSKKLLGCPQMDTHRIGPSCKVRYIADKDNGVWAFDGLEQVVDQYVNGVSHMTKYASGKMTITMIRTYTIDITSDAGSNFYGITGAESFIEQFISAPASSIVTTNTAFYEANMYTVLDVSFRAVFKRDVSTAGASVGTSIMFDGDWKDPYSIS